MVVFYHLHAFRGCAAVAVDEEKNAEPSEVPA